MSTKTKKNHYVPIISDYFPMDCPIQPPLGSYRKPWTNWVSGLRRVWAPFSTIPQKTVNAISFVHICLLISKLTIRFSENHNLVLFMVFDASEPHGSCEIRGSPVKWGVQQMSTILIFGLAICLKLFAIRFVLKK